MVLAENMRVLRLIDGIPENRLGTVVARDTDGRVCVKWDDGAYSSCSEERLVSHQRLKSWFKHGPKLKKHAL